MSGEVPAGAGIPVDPVEHVTNRYPANLDALDGNSQLNVRPERGPGPTPARGHTLARPVLALEHRVPQRPAGERELNDRSLG